MINACYLSIDLRLISDCPPGLGRRRLIETGEVNLSPHYVPDLITVTDEADQMKRRNILRLNYRVQLIEPSSKVMR